MPSLALLARERHPASHVAAAAATASALRWWVLSDREWWASPELIVEAVAADATAAVAGLNKEEREGVRVAAVAVAVAVAGVAVALDK